MEAKTKRKIGDLIFIIIYICLASGMAYTYYLYENTKDIVVEQNAFIKQITGKDSVFLDESKKYQDSLHKITEKFYWYIDGKEVGADQFLQAYKKLERERDSIKAMYNHAQGIYGFRVKYKRWKKGDTTYTNTSTIGTTRADSAALTYYFFKDRIKKDKDGSWTAYLDSEEFTDKLNHLKKTLDSLNLKLK